MSKSNLLEKVIVSNAIGSPAGSGLLAPQQADEFIDYMWDATVVGSQVRKVRMRANEMELDKMSVGERIIRAATEAVDTGVNQGVVFAKISLTTRKIRLDWEISTETLEDNIEGEGLEDHIARLMATQMGNDLEDLAINGDTTSSVPSLKIFDGWRKIAVQGNTEGAAHVVSHGGQPLNRAAFNAAIKEMPRRYMQTRPDMKFFVGSAAIQDYLFSITEDPNYSESIGTKLITDGPVRASGVAGFSGGYAFGVPFQEIPKFSQDAAGTYSGAAGTHSDVWFLNPKNLVWGIKREIQVLSEFKNKKDTWEYTVYCRVGVQIENTDSMVVLTDVKTS